MCQCANVCISHGCLVPLKARSRHGSCGTGVTGSCEPLCGCWELSPGLLQELLTAGASLQSFYWIFFFWDKFCQVGQAGLELSTFLPQPLKSWDDSVHHHTGLQLCPLPEARGPQGPHKNPTTTRPRRGSYLLRYIAMGDTGPTSVTPSFTCVTYHGTPLFFCCGVVVHFWIFFKKRNMVSLWILGCPGTHFVD